MKFTKTTEIDGRFFGDCEGMSIELADKSNEYLWNLLPPEARPAGMAQKGPRGRFKITIEFEPAD